MPTFDVTCFKIGKHPGEVEIGRIQFKKDSAFHPVTKRMEYLYAPGILDAANSGVAVNTVLNYKDCSEHAHEIRMVQS